MPEEKVVTITDHQPCPHCSSEMLKTSNNDPINDYVTNYKCTECGNEKTIYN